ncbi:MAG: hypothetical protein AB1861_25350 [Cyanobacteriota bacterium]
MGTLLQHPFAPDFSEFNASQSFTIWLVTFARYRLVYSLPRDSTAALKISINVKKADSAIEPMKEGIEDSISKLSFPLISVPESRVFFSTAFDITTKKREELHPNYKDFVWVLSRNLPEIMKEFYRGIFLIKYSSFFLCLDDK